MRNYWIRFAMLILFSLPTGVFALYLEHTYYIEIGFIVSVFLTYILALSASYMKAYKTWILGNLLLLVTSYWFIHSVGYNLAERTTDSRFPMLLIVFFLCWLVPQVFGTVWGSILRKSSMKGFAKSQKTLES